MSRGGPTIVAGPQRPEVPVVRADAGARGPDERGAAWRAIVAATARQGWDWARERAGALVGHGISAVIVARWWLEGLAGWAAARRLSPGMLTGIALLCALSAMFWLGGGTAADALPGAVAVLGWTLARAGARQLAGPGEATRVRAARGVGEHAWLAAVAGVVAESAIYAGIAAGGQAAGWPAMWPLAVAVVSTVAIAEATGWYGGQATRARVGPPPGARASLAAALLLIHGPRVALVTVLATEVAAICYAVIRLIRRCLAGPPPGAERAAVLLAGRDDGPVARWAGRLVRGNLPPLSPTVVGVVATAGLAALGLGSPGGAIALAPFAVLLLAAPGSSHPHDKRLDWLVPIVLLLGQLLYLAALGFASAVPGPLVFACCALTAAWYACRAAGPPGPLGWPKLSAAGHAPGSAAARPGAGIGWEGRIFLAGLAATLGLGTLGYLGLAAYLAAAICRTWLAAYPRLGEGVGQ